MAGIPNRRGKVQTGLKLDPDLYERAKARAASELMTFHQFVTQLLRSVLDRPSKRGAR